MHLVLLQQIHMLDKMKANFHKGLQPKMKTKTFYLFLSIKFKNTLLRSINEKLKINSKKKQMY